ncbi:MAG TPA: YlbF family regulator [Candidatus Paceibacterota bacterium]|nr:YlbF family regulator [Verrucomicrobiota bacterium]HOX01876.1 YlbF family regulator [Verrucomicrobiota bacterium]HRZ44786.1 YlbF family regulator [Candidatus Paceibacterota bacterium]HRZ91766.1 YlbF family regulator [Candidatus Paceibacterota bacterium]
METQLIHEESPVIVKARELCQAILDHPGYANLRQRIENFMVDEKAQDQYRDLTERSQLLQHKQRRGEELSESEITLFESDREKLFQNPTARDFFDAQQEMQRVQSTLGKYVTKTFELGRVPNPGDLNCGSCCSCEGH